MRTAGCSARGAGRDGGTGAKGRRQAPPEGDAKLAERLTDYFGDYPSQDDMVQQLELSHVHYGDNEASLAAFNQAFGQFDKTSGKGLQTLRPINAEHGKSEEDVGR